VTPEQASKQVAAVPATVSQALRKGLAAGLVLIASRAQAGYLSGPRPGKLGVVSGRLRGSIATSIREDSTSFIGTVGTNLIYGRYHELGFHGVQNVKAFQRIRGVILKTVAGKKVYGLGAKVPSNLTGNTRYNERILSLHAARGPRIDSRTGKVVGYRRSAALAARELLRKNPGLRLAFSDVKAHTRKVEYDGRPFLRPAIIDMQPQLTAEIQKALAQVPSALPKP
jgi:phage gpG-like protein